MESLQSDVANFSKSLVDLKKLMKNVMTGNKTEADRFRGCYLITQLKNFNAQGITKNLTLIWNKILLMAKIEFLAQSHKEEIISRTEEAKAKMIEKEESSRNFKFRVRQLEKKAEAERLFAARHISLISRKIQKKVQREFSSKILFWQQILIFYQRTVFIPSAGEIIESF